MNKNKNIPVETNATRSIFSESSLNFSLSIEENSLDKANSLRYLGLSDEAITFEIRLKLPKQTPETKVISNTACVQYDETKKPNPVACESWYDETAFEVVCQCQKQGLIVNVLDDFLSFAGKLAQFPLLSTEIRIQFFLMLYYFLKHLNHHNIII